MSRIFKFFKKLVFLLVILFVGFFIYTNFFVQKNVAIVFHQGDFRSVNYFQRKLYKGNVGCSQIDLNLENVDFYIDILDQVDGVIFAGGNDFDPAIYGGGDRSLVEDYDFSDDKADIRFLEACLDKDIPVLGVCRGFQLINIYFGGSLYEDLPSQFSKKIKHRNGKDGFTSHNVTLEHNSRLFELLGEENWTVNSYHHQGVKDLGQGLVVNARSDDGLVEAFENPSYKYLCGIQWHPEAEDENLLSDRIFDDFLSSLR